MNQTRELDELAAAGLAVQAAQADFARATEALRAHQAARPGAGGDVRSWAAEKTRLLSEQEAYAGILDDAQARQAAAQDVADNERRRRWQAEHERAIASWRETVQAGQAEFERLQKQLVDAQAQAAERARQAAHRVAELRQRAPAGILPAQMACEEERANGFLFLSNLS